MFSANILYCYGPRILVLIHPLTHWPLGDLNMILKNVIFNLALLIGILKSYDNVLRWMPQDLTNDKSTLVQAMALWRQATSHYLNQCWPRSPTPYGVTRPQWVNKLIVISGIHFTEDFPLAIIIWWKIHLPVIPYLAIMLLQISVYGMTAALLYNMQNLVLIT